jgi:hypothetical protein
LEEIVEAAVLLNDINYVRDFARARAAERAQLSAALHVRYRGLRPGRATNKRKKQKDRNTTMRHGV